VYIGQWLILILAAKDLPSKEEGSLTQAIQSFDDAFLALQAVEEPGYKTALPA